MAWRDNLEEASFRGVSFLYESVTSSVGRRTVVHEYPGRDDAEIEDLGRRAGRFQLEAYVLGDEYMAKRDRLVEAFEKRGTGELVHPYWGTILVAVDGEVRITESTRDGGMARISATMVEAEIRAPALYLPDTAAKLGTAADEALDAATDTFVEAYSTVGAIENAVDGAEAAVNAGFTALRSVKGNINSALNLVDDGMTAIQNAVNALGSVMRIPGDLAAAINGRVAQVMASGAAIEDSVADLLALGLDANLPYSAGAASQAWRSSVIMAAWRSLDAFDAEGATVLGTGSQPTIEAQNLAAIIWYWRVAATVEAVRAISEITFDSFDRAFSVLEELAQALDDLATVTDDDVEYRTLRDLRSALALHIQSTAADLPRIVEFTPAETAPALVIAQRLYGDALMAEDLILRNGLRNPAAVPGAQVLEVLASD